MEISCQSNSETSDQDAGISSVGNSKSKQSCFRCKTCLKIFLGDIPADYILQHMKEHGVAERSKSGKRTISESTTTVSEENLSEDNVHGQSVFITSPENTVLDEKTCKVEPGSCPDNDTNISNTSCISNMFESSPGTTHTIKSNIPYAKSSGFENTINCKSQLHQSEVPSPASYFNADSCMLTRPILIPASVTVSKADTNAPLITDIRSSESELPVDTFLIVQSLVGNDPTANASIELIPTLTAGKVLVDGTSLGDSQLKQKQGENVVFVTDDSIFHVAVPISDSLVTESIKVKQEEQHIKTSKSLKSKMARPEKKHFSESLEEVQCGPPQEQNVDSAGDIFSQKDKKLSSVTSSDLTTLLAGHSYRENVSEMKENVVSRQKVFSVNIDSMSHSPLECEFSSDAEPDDVTETNDVTSFLARLESDCDAGTTSKDLQPPPKKRKVGRPKKKGFRGRRYVKDSALREQTDCESDINSLSTPTIPQPECKVVLVALSNKGCVLKTPAEKQEVGKANKCTPGKGCAIQPDKFSNVNSDINFETSFSVSKTCNLVITDSKAQPAVSEKQGTNPSIRENTAHSMDKGQDDGNDIPNESTTITPRELGISKHVNSQNDTEKCLTSKSHLSSGGSGKSLRESDGLSDNERSCTLLNQGRQDQDKVIQTQTEHGKTSKSVKSVSSAKNANVPKLVMSAAEKGGNQHLHEKTNLKGNNVKGKTTMCNICGKILTTGYIQYHIDTFHGSIKCNPCDICGKSFFRKCKLIEHRRIHTGERPFKCKKCPSTFAKRQNFRKHLETHEKIRECETCAFTCDSYAKLMNHRHVHDTGTVIGKPQKSHDQDMESADDNSKPDDKISSLETSSNATTLMPACPDAENTSEMKENASYQPEVVSVNKNSVFNILSNLEVNSDAEHFGDEDNSENNLSRLDSDSDVPFDHKDSTLQSKVRRSKMARPKKAHFSESSEEGQCGPPREQNVDSAGDVFSRRDKKLSSVTSSDLTALLAGHSYRENVSEMKENVVSRQKVFSVNIDSMSHSPLECEFSSDAEPDDVTETNDVTSFLARLESDCDAGTTSNDLQPPPKKRKVGRPKKKGFRGRRYVKDSALREQTDCESDINSISTPPIPQPECKVVLAALSNKSCVLKTPAEKQEVGKANKCTPGKGCAIQPDKSSNVNSDINFETSFSVSKTCNLVTTDSKAQPAVSEKQGTNPSTKENTAHRMDKGQDDDNDIPNESTTITPRELGISKHVNSQNDTEKCLTSKSHLSSGGSGKSLRESDGLSDNERSCTLINQGRQDQDKVIQTQTEHGKTSKSVKSVSSAKNANVPKLVMSAAEKGGNQHLHEKTNLEGNNVKGKTTMCDICGKILTTGYIQYHIDTFHGSIKCNPCDICGKSFFRKCKLIEHRRIHTGERPFKCKKCPSTFAKRQNFRKHLETHEKTRECETCAFTCDSYAKLMNHRHVHDTGTVIGPCEYCGAKFREKRSLARHISHNHPGQLAYKCDRCGDMFRTLESYREHKSQHKVQVSWECDKCDKIFKHKKTLQIHQLRHANILNFCCDQCGKCFVSQNNLRAHVLCVHENIKRKANIICKICSYRFYNMQQLNRHMNSRHSDSNDFKCHCGKCFSDESYLKIHMRLHTGELPYKCKLCDKAYGRQSSLYKHSLTHGHNKIYKCKVCGKEFTNDSCYYKHKSVHSERRFKCSQCNLAFKRSFTLRVHIRTHTGEKPYKCTQCGKGLGSSTALKKHKAWHEKVDSKNASEIKSSKAHTKSAKFHPKASKSSKPRDKSFICQSRSSKPNVKASTAKPKVKSSKRVSIYPVSDGEEATGDFSKIPDNNTSGDPSNLDKSSMVSDLRNGRDCNSKDDLFTNCSND